MTAFPPRDDLRPATAPAGLGRATFYAGVPVFDGFNRVVDDVLYVPLPDDWLIGITDVVSSTAAIAAGRYGEVNMAGAAAIAAVAHALGDQDFPFIFGGDGASFAVPASDEPVVRAALAATVRWATEGMDLTLRAALVPVAAIRAAGLDVRLARFAASPAISYAMAMGGGLAWANQRMKAGEFAVTAAPAGTEPDLGGLSCRFAEVPSRHGIILSMIVEARLDAAGRPLDVAAFRVLLADILALAEEDGARPLPGAGPPVKWPPKGLELETRARHRRGGILALTRLRVAAETLFAWMVFRFGIRVAGFDPVHYRAEVTANADFRKFEDGLKMTIDCTPAVADQIEARLKAAATIARYGLHRQDAAVLTCFVPTLGTPDHVHFVDGASGGYAAAAAQLKAN